MTRRDRRHRRHPAPPRAVRVPGPGAHAHHVPPGAYVYDALRAGASGFLLKSSPPRELAGAIRTVAAGEALLAPEITRAMIEDFVQRPRPGSATPDLVRTLTPRELEVLGRIARGRSNGEIAGDLFLSEPTVKTHVTRILAKLQLRDRVHAVVLAYECGLVRPGAR